MSLNWYAVYTRPKLEKKVAEALTRKKIENYCPVNKVAGEGERKKMRYEPLFASYVFVRVAEKELMELKKMDGILNIIHWLGKPAIISEVEIELMKQFLQQYEYVSLEKTFINRNGSGFISDYQESESESNGLVVTNHRIKLNLFSLGYAIVSERQRIKVDMLKEQIGQVFSNS